MRRFLCLLLLCSGLSLSLLTAGEGMWLPLLLKSLNEGEMQRMGLKLTAEDIYSVNQGSLKDAIVHFGGFCTGEVISAEGLLLTNHHCGYGQIQQHTTLENNYLEDGFWAKKREDELPNPGLYVTFIARIEDVTEAALEGVTLKMDERLRQSRIDKNLAAIKEACTREVYQDVKIRPFFHGNQYYLFVTETYSDVRLVGAPPSSIGKYGADTDNWEWPRHTGDFSLFRIYTAPDGSPAPYSPENVPMQAKYHLPISTQGVKEGDFTMVFGFPGRTDQYLPARAMQNRTKVINPIRITMRDSSLAVIDRYMRQDPEIKIQYASKQARIANAWKKWRGESEGVAKTKGIGRKQKLEKEFSKLLGENTSLPRQYNRILPTLNKAHDQQLAFAKSRAYVAELNYNIDLFRLCNRLVRYRKIFRQNGGGVAIRERAVEVTAYLENFYRNYRPEVDEAVAQKLIPIYYQQVDPEHQSQTALDQLQQAGSQEQMITDLFTRSFLTKPDETLRLLKSSPESFIKQVQGDIAFQYVLGLNQDHRKLVDLPYERIQTQINQLQRAYMAALIKVFPRKRFYPDANSTLRLSYGKIEGYESFDGQAQAFATHLNGVIEKHVPGDYEFSLPDKLLQLHQKKDFGRWADETGDVPVCLLGSNHTTGGNSGSPAINGKGELVGLNFDRTWEGTMSDINYDASICRNIMVDIRYVLFLIEKLGDAPQLIDEMTLK
ncbi:MAG: S46 family peptidase [Bacteroidota bacterium]